MYNWQNLALLVAGLINLSMSMFVLGRGIKNKVNLFFSLLAFFNFLWAGSLFLSQILNIDKFAEFFYRTAYLAAMGISVFLFYFSLYFPFKNQKIKKTFHVFVISSSLILSIMVYTKLHIIKFIRTVNLVDWNVLYNNNFYIIYSLIFFCVIISAIYFLISKLKNLDGIMYSRTVNLTVTIIIGLIFGSYFDLILCYFGNFSYIWFGPIFTLFMNIYVFYLITSKK